MPLGLPPHLTTNTAVIALRRAGRASAAVCLVAVALMVLSLQAYVPQAILWPALLVFLPMLALLVLLERSPSAFIAASYLGVGGLCVVWYSLISSTELGTPVANDDVIIGLLKLSLIMVMGVGSGVKAAVLWTTAAYVTGEIASAVAILWLGAPWSFDAGSFVAWMLVVGLLALVRAKALTDRHAQAELYRAARDEVLAQVRHDFEQRATAMLHDTVLNQLAVIASAPERLPSSVRSAVAAELEKIVGHEWFSVGSHDHEAAGPSVAVGRPTRLRTVIDQAAAGELTVVVDGDESALERLDPEVLEEFLRAIGQCITNARRHAGVDQVELIISGSASEVSAMVVDAGIGFTIDAHTYRGLGVGTSVVGRLETVGGSATIWSQPGMGTSVLLRVPLRPEPPNSDAEVFS